MTGRLEGGALLALRRCYEEYLEERELLLQAGGAFQGVSRFFTGPPAGERLMARRFLQRLAQCVEQLPPEGADAVVQGAEYMLLSVHRCDYNSQLMFQAAESYALPLIPRLEREDAARLLRGYRARYPKPRMLMPKQREVLSALERAAG